MSCPSLADHVVVRVARAQHDPEDEPTAPPIPEEFFDFDKHKDSLSKEQLKQLIYQEIMR